MAVQNKLLYAFRGWIAFVAFMDLGTAFRSYIERRSFFGHHLENEYLEDDFTVSRMLGMYSILKALALIHCTLYIHYRPVVSMGYWSLFLTIVLYCTEALYFHSTTLNFYVIFPCVLNALTLAGLIYLPGYINLWGSGVGVVSNGSSIGFDDDENSLLLRQLGHHPRHKRTRKQL
ncbi:uncharacterized protein LOC143923202 isoform X2 [Arctopsyche grandis]|uniref:uncharacterized protein LOC143923202 isoform X2 n=1 Tax=Arctopsyche grandis TaxID=121162 RepID=UPI00406D6C51